MKSLAVNAGPRRMPNVRQIAPSMRDCADGVMHPCVPNVGRAASAKVTGAHRAASVTIRRVHVTTSTIRIKTRC